MKYRIKYDPYYSFTKYRVQSRCALWPFWADIRGYSTEGGAREHIEIVLKINKPTHVVAEFRADGTEV